MKIILARSNTPLSWAIRLATEEDGFPAAEGFSHVGTIMSDGVSVMDATMRSGVRPPRPLASFQAYYPDHVIANIPCPRDDLGDEWNLAQVGKYYDFKALGAFVAPPWMTGRRNWQDPNRWFCSEKAAARAVACGFSFDRSLQFVSPNLLAFYAGLRPKARPASLQGLMPA